MDNLKHFISQYNDIFSLSGIIIGILGVILAVIFYQKSKRIKKSSFQKRGFNLINESLSKLPHLEVRYKNNIVSNLTVTNIAIWNSGNETIDRKELVELDPLKIVSDEAVVIFDCEITEIIEPSNNFKIINEGNVIKIEFDYFDPKQGCSIKVFHSGKSSQNISVQGKFKGQERITENEDFGNNSIIYKEPFSKAPAQVKGMIILLEKIAWVSYLLLSIISLVYSFYENNFWILLVTAFCTFCSYALFPRTHVPKKLQNIFSDDSN